VRAELEREHYTLASWEIGERLLVRNELPESITTAVGKHYDQPSGSLGPTGRVTAFGRVIAPELMALGPEGEVQELADRMMQVARLCDLDVDSDVLVQLAERAMAAAEETLVSG
jgi:hypothetical protein